MLYKCETYIYISNDKVCKAIMKSEALQANAKALTKRK